MKNTVYVRAFVAADIVAKTVNLVFRVSDLLKISSDGDTITIHKVTCSLCGHTKNIRQYFRDKWVCDKCAEEISKGVVRDSRFVDGKHGADATADSGAESTGTKRGSYSDYNKEFEPGDGAG